MPGVNAPAIALDTSSQGVALVSAGRATATACSRKASRSARRKPIRSASVPASSGPAMAPMPNTTQ